jgi:hypothetical protein
MMFNQDITGGSNPGCHTAGFNGAKGWYCQCSLAARLFNELFVCSRDPVTGVGVMNFEKFRTYVQSLP